MKNNEIKLICSDIDGTLIKADQTIGILTKDAVKKAVDNGIHFAIVTGRFKTGAETVIEKLGLSNNQVSGVYDNGAYVEANGKVVNAEGVPHNTILEISKLAKQYGARPVLFSGEEWVVEECDRWWAKINGFYEGRGVVEPFEETMRKSFLYDSEEPVKLVLRLDNTEAMTSLRDDLNKRYPDLFFFLSHIDILEVSMKHIDKGTGMDALASYFGLTKDNVMALGDFDNDIPMLKKAKYGIAMANGTIGAKNASKYTTLSCEEDGVGKAINKFIFGQN